MKINMHNVAKIKQYFDDIASRRDYWKQKNRYYYDYVENNLLPFLIPPGRRVLEVGCGTGDLLAQLKPSMGLGIDISEKMVQIARQKYRNNNLKFKTAQIGEIEESGEPFDFIVLSDLVGFLADVQDVFEIYIV
jgi:ubiquinone/menaquinone biosynthesis C-methylase UbiE